MILVDSTVWVDYFNGKMNWQTDRLDHYLQHELLPIGDIILAEVLQGFRNKNEFRKAKKALQILPCIPLCGQAIAIKSAQNYRLLRQKGITVRKTIDMIIGTFCIINRFDLLHNDKDFLPIAEHLGLKCIPAK